MREGGNAIRRSAMALNLTQKQEVVAELAEVAGSAHSLVAAEYVGLTVAQLTDMRKKARQEGVFLKVAKNTLVSRAVENTDYAVVKDALTGPLLYAFSRSEEHPSELQSLMRISYAFFCLNKKTTES